MRKKTYRWTTEISFWTPISMCVDRITEIQPRTLHHLRKAIFELNPFSHSQISAPNFPICSTYKIRHLLMRKWRLIKWSKLLKIKSKITSNLFNKKFGLKLWEFNNTTGTERVSPTLISGQSWGIECRRPGFKSPARTTEGICPGANSPRFVNSQLVCLLPVGILNWERGGF